MDYGIELPNHDFINKIINHGATVRINNDVEETISEIGDIPFNKESGVRGVIAPQHIEIDATPAMNFPETLSEDIRQVRIQLDGLDESSPKLIEFELSFINESMVKALSDLVTERFDSDKFMAGGESDDYISFETQDLSDINKLLEYLETENGSEHLYELSVTNKLNEPSTLSV